MNILLIKMMCTSIALALALCMFAVVAVDNEGVFNVIMGLLVPLVVFPILSMVYLIWTHVGG